MLALMVGWASPASATTRQAAFQWAPATGPVAGYAVYASINGAFDQLVSYTLVPSATLSVESSASLRVGVAAYDSAGRLGPRSDASVPLRLCPGDFDGDQIIGIMDWMAARSCLGQPGQGFCAAADVNLDGTVGGLDLQSATVGSAACPPAQCLGDFDGDQIIGVADWNAARSCLGQPALGICAAGDYDGNGIVASYEVSYMRQSLGSDACTQ
jgi:hypothetical protein